MEQELEKLREVKAKGQQVKQAVNKLYRSLEVRGLKMHTRVCFQYVSVCIYMCVSPLADAPTPHPQRPPHPPTQLELDGIFKCMLLLKKKKYAALTVSETPEGGLSYAKELKGLDLVGGFGLAKGHR